LEAKEKRRVVCKHFEKQAGEYAEEVKGMDKRVDKETREAQKPLVRGEGRKEPESVEDDFSRWAKWLGLAAGVFVVLAFALGAVMLYGGRRASAAEDQASQLRNSLVPTASPVPTLTVPGPRNTPVGALVVDDDEVYPVASGKFPGDAPAPSIIQWWDPENKQCGIFYITSNEPPFHYDQLGTWWQFASDQGMLRRYSDHRAEYFNSHPDGYEAKP
jgi:hypothetical protein